jgi:hypothetical protein
MYAAQHMYVCTHVPITGSNHRALARPCFFLFCSGIFYEKHNQALPLKSLIVTNIANGRTLIDFALFTLETNECVSSLQKKS